MPPAAVLVVLLAAAAHTASIFEHASRGKCQPIDIPICKDIPYNYTYYPSSLSQLDQHGAQAQTDHFKPLIKTKCNPHIQFFICSVFAPMCPVDMPQEVTSCRSVCLQVKRDCVSILEEFGIAWPDLLNCDRFPEEPALCMKQPEEHDKRHHGSGHKSRQSSVLSGGGACPSDLLDVDPMDPRGICATKCGYDVMFTSQDKKQATFWLQLWGSVDFCVSVAAVFTFLIDRARFPFPQRCAFFMAICSMMYSIPHLFPFFMVYSAMACDKTASGQAYLVFSGFENTNCLFSFALTYFFGTAIFLWWFLFAFTWYLSAACKWVSEGISVYSSVMHCFAWGVSSVLTIAVLVMHRVDASELTGLCGVGNTDPQTQMIFSLLPRTLLLLAGTFLMLAGFASLCRERESMRNAGVDTSKSEKLMVKTIMFCAVYLLPTVVSLVCEAYHYLQIGRWQPATTKCKTFGGAENCVRPLMPQVEFYLLGVMMSLAVGLAPVIWILSAKSLYSWQRFICCGLCGAPPKKTQLTASRPLLEPPSGPPPQPPSGHYLPMSTHSQNVWRA